MRPVDVLLIVALLAAGCATPRSEEPLHPADAHADDEPRSVAPSRPAPDAAPPAERPPSAEDGLVDAWAAAADGWSGDAVRDAAAAQLLRAEEAGFDALARALAGDDETRRAAAIALIPCFEERAGVALAERLEAGTVDAADVAAVLPGISRFCRTPAAGESLWRALMPHFDDPALYDGKVHDALRDMAMSARGLATELTARWEGSDGRAAETAAMALVALRTWSGDAALVAAPYLSEHDLTDDRGRQAFWIVYWSGRTDRELLDPVAALTRSKDAGTREAAARLLRIWGPPARPAAPKLLHLLRDPGRDVRTEALRALRRMPDIVEQHWREILAIPLETDVPADDLAGLFMDDALYARLVAALPELSAAERHVAHSILCVAQVPSPVVVEDVLRYGERDSRLYFLDRMYLGSYLGEDAPPACVAELLDDPDADIRTAAFRVAAAHDALPPARAADLAQSYLSSTDDGARLEAFAALARAAPDDPDLLPRALQAVTRGDTALQAAAIRVLGSGTGVLPGDHADVVAAIRVSLEMPHSPMAGSEAHVHALLRFDGGERAARTAVERRVHDRTADESVMQAARLLGDETRERLVAWLRTRTGSDPYASDAIVSFLGDCCSEPRVIGACGEVSVATAERLLALGDEGRAELPVLVARAHGEVREELLARLAGVITEEDVERAARRGTERRPPPHRSSGPRPWAAPVPGADLHGRKGVDAVDQAARQGAAILTRLLPDERRVPLLARFASDPLMCATALDELIRIEMDRPGAVPVGVAAGLLHDDVARGFDETIELAARMGPRAAELRDALAERLDGWAIALSVADAIRRVSGDDTDLRRVLLAGQRSATGLLADGGDARAPADPVMALAATIDWTPAERETILRRFLRGAHRSDQERWLPLVAALGDDAAPAVPELCRLLQQRYRDSYHGDSWVSSGPGRPFARALAALGPTARDAIPAVRHWIGATGGGDDDGRPILQALGADGD